MKKYIFFSLVLLLLFPGILWSFSLPINEVSTLYTGPRDLSVGVDALLTEGKYMAVLYRLAKRVDPDSYTVCIVNLDSGEKTYEASFPRGENISYLPWVGHFSIKNGYLTYISEKRTTHLVTIHRVELTTGAETTKSFTSAIIPESDDNKIIIFDRDKKKLYVYHPQDGDVTTYDIPYKELPYDDFVTDTKCIVYNEGIYVLKDVTTGDTITIGEGMRSFLPGAPIFGLLTHIQSDDWTLKLYKSDGTHIKDISLTDLLNDNKVITFTEVDTSQKASLFRIKAGIDPTYIHYLLIDTQGNILKQVSGQDIEDAKIVKEDQLMIFRHILNGDRSDERTFTYNDISFGFPSFADLFPYAHYVKNGTEEELLMEFNGSDGICKYSLSDGKIKGLYLFPARYITKYVTTYNNKIYVLSYNNTYSIEDKSTTLKLYSFPVSSEGWIPVDVRFSPTFGDPDTLYENTDTRVDIRGDCDYELDKLTVEVDKGTLSYDMGYVWHTPQTTTSQETAHLIFKLGPLTRKYPVTIKRPQNPLSIHMEKSKINHDPWVFNINGTIENSLDMEIDGLTWKVETKGIRPTTDGRKWEEYLPKIVSRAGGGFSIYGYVLSDDVNVKWDGYRIVRRFKVILDYKWGHVESSISDDLTIEPKYYFTIELKDKDTGRVPLEIDKEDLNRLRIFTEDGKDITKDLKISFKGPHLRTNKVTKKEERVGDGIVVSGISPGLPGKPLHLILKYGPYTKEVDLFFDARYGYKYSYPTFVMGVDKETGLKLVVKDEDGNKIYDAHIIVKKVGADFSYVDYSVLSPGRYDVSIWKKGYIPYHEEVTLEKRKKKTLEVTLKKFVGIIFNLESYYSSAFKDVKKCQIKDAMNLNKVTDHVYILPEGHDTLYFGMTYKVGYPDTVSAKMFAEDKYYVSCDVKKAKEESYIYSNDVYQGKDIKTFSEDELFRSKDSMESVNITKPTLILVELEAKAKHTKKEKSGIWFFPSSWIGYETEIKQALILYQLKNDKITDEELKKTLSFGIDAKNYLANKAGDDLLYSALLDIVEYGTESMKFLKDALGVPDFGILDIANEGIEQYIDYSLDKAAEDGIIDDKSKVDVDSILKDTLIKDVAGGVWDAIGIIEEAGDWAKGLFNIVSSGVAKTITANMLENLANRHSFDCIVNMLNYVYDPIVNVVNAMKDNQPEKVREEMGKIKACIEGGSCGDKCQCEYPLSIYFILEFDRIGEWKGYDVEKGNFLSKKKEHDCNDWPPITIDPGLLDVLSYDRHDKCLSAKYAMEIYEPIMKKLFHIASPIIDACSVEYNK